MNITVLLFAACTIVLPPSITAQETSAPRSATHSWTIAFARIEANRVGINTDTLDQVPLRVWGDSSGSGVHFADHYRHAVIGGFFGALGGAAIGAAAGAVADARAEEVMIPATAIGAIYGGIGGLALGLLIGVAWPVR
jgi:hypothetical protein